MDNDNVHSNDKHLFNMKAGSPLPRRLSSRQVGDESRQPQQSKFNRKLYIL